MRHLVAALAKPASGPGWANSPILLLWVEGGEYTVEYVQPEDQPAAARILYPIASQALGQLTGIMATELSLSRWG